MCDSYMDSKEPTLYRHAHFSVDQSINRIALKCYKIIIKISASTCIADRSEVSNLLTILMPKVGRSNFSPFMKSSLRDWNSDADTKCRQNLDLSLFY